MCCVDKQIRRGGDRKKLDFLVENHLIPWLPRCPGVATPLWRLTDSLVEIDKEGENIEANFDEPFFGVEVQLSTVHDLRGVVQSWTGHGWTMGISGTERNEGEKRGRERKEGRRQDGKDKRKEV